MPNPATIRVASEPFGLAQARVACSQCNLRELCMPVGLSEAESSQLDRLVATRRTLRKGEALFRLNDPFTSLYAIRLGTFKTRVGTSDGRDQVTGFQVTGELVGLDGIGSGRHACDAVALEDAEVCEIPYVRLDKIARELPALQRHFHQLMSREIVREHGVMLLLGSMRADERVAAFLLNLLQRMHTRGYSGREIVLRMTREEIGSYLGLKLETVSRTLSRMADEGLISVNQRRVRIEALDRLRAMVQAGDAQS
ncbi:fumarate/nitrate reduction transcriptional regulator Fnr [Verticiella sediminum]|uniref:Fumarate/nitrate reduction transcriptional regulator Fnr n=1 Tax=Verticiella sediminum TaxID=1247510 RepID=A0A556AKR8_9BURK|nr:fumarate/nitrate reduction transcriptional regulator Fnr [Verticiella sediminum]TSH93445.1 fumarate/nitrate reduction transcriptional regulator Fnr [Verticiella sediminum]